MFRLTEKEYLDLLRRRGKTPPSASETAQCPATDAIPKKPPKYHNHRVYVYRDGLVCQEKLDGHGGLKERFDSVKEYNRWNELLLMERAGVISNLQRQTPLIIQPPFRDKDGKRHRAIVYRADATYIKNGVEIVEDVKGFDNRKAKYRTTEAFNIKWKLLQRLYPSKTFKIY